MLFAAICLASTWLWLREETAHWLSCTRHDVQKVVVLEQNFSFSLLMLLHASLQRKGIRRNRDQFQPRIHQGPCYVRVPFKERQPIWQTFCTLSICRSPVRCLTCTISITCMWIRSESAVFARWCESSLTFMSHRFVWKDVGSHRKTFESMRVTSCFFSYGARNNEAKLLMHPLILNCLISSTLFEMHGFLKWHF